ncbi:hypothetical protein SERLA73DRAFT_175387 [Serpula lacrymans var. lacrymans S7.3]|uniref:Uncharacterized protein n=1 Tax=Serpula lacrymans var. lacrymans (strain S7.3) TaxID=936435 RepID=F8PJD6_SERL3|nr:hypothetical protein SERLA73DRAFT_175387 [Serpula lacrymans var. lacrymans S7.3]
MLSAFLDRALQQNFLNFLYSIYSALKDEIAVYMSFDIISSKQFHHVPSLRSQSYYLGTAKIQYRVDTAQFCASSWYSLRHFDHLVSHHSTRNYTPGEHPFSRKWKLQSLMASFLFFYFLFVVERQCLLVFLFASHRQTHR